ncbi:endonuclease domain-containing protein [Streptomyces sp. NPDC001401]|uniref:endonuclease domain-containing protein n=1 Tax=Streptomyces sp. NPDC001401 TaxID=3364570 RepID=UPI00369C6400
MAGQSDDPARDINSWASNQASEAPSGVAIQRDVVVSKGVLFASHPQCAICGHIARSIDRDHETDLVRGALCQQCNGRLGSLEAALRMLRRVFQSLAGDLHRAYAQSGTVDLSRFASDFPYLGMTEGEYLRRLAILQAQLTQRYVYWTEISLKPLSRDTEWIKTGPLIDDEEVERVLERLQNPAKTPPHLTIFATLEPDDGVNSPGPRALTFAHRTPGALEYLLELRRADDSPGTPLPGYEEKCRAFVRDVVPILLSRPLKLSELRATGWVTDEPADEDALRELIGERYSPRWVDLAVRIALKDLGDNLPDRRWASFTKARWHWQKLCAHWHSQHPESQGCARVPQQPASLTDRRPCPHLPCRRRRPARWTR